MSEKRYTKRPRGKRIDPSVIELSMRIVTICVMLTLAFTTAAWRARAVDATEDLSTVRGELKRMSAALSTEYDRTAELEAALYSTSLARAGQAVQIRALEASVTALTEQLQKATVTAPAQT